jgi:hypothetical protein
MNHLYSGDNLHVVREHIADASADLVYPDPPFNSKRDYNFPRVQVLTIAGLLDGSEHPRHPDLAQGRHTFENAKVDQGNQPGHDGLFGH